MEKEKKSRGKNYFSYISFIKTVTPGVHPGEAQSDDSTTRPTVTSEEEKQRAVTLITNGSTIGHLLSPPLSTPLPSMHLRTDAHLWQSYNMAMISGVQLRWVDVLLPPGDLRPLVAPLRVEPRAPGPMMPPVVW